MLSVYQFLWYFALMHHIIFISPLCALISFEEQLYNWLQTGRCLPSAVKGGKSCNFSMTDIPFLNLGFHIISSPFHHSTADVQCSKTSQCSCVVDKLGFLHAKRIEVIGLVWGRSLCGLLACLCRLEIRDLTEKVYIGKRITKSLLGICKF